MTDKVEETKEETKGAETIPVKEPTIEELKAEVQKLQSINKEAIESRQAVKARLKELESKEEQEKAKLLADQGQFKKLYEDSQAELTGLRTKLETEKVDVELTKVLTEQGVNDINIAKKLVDKSAIKVVDGVVDQKSITTMLDTMKKEYKSLFTNVKAATPDTKQPAQNVQQLTYVDELRKLRETGKATPAQLSQLRQKYGRN